MKRETHENAEMKRNCSKQIIIGNVYKQINYCLTINSESITIYSML